MTSSQDKQSALDAVLDELEKKMLERLRAVAAEAYEIGRQSASSSSAATVPAVLTPMALLNAAVCVEGIVEVPQEKRQKIAADLCRMADEMKRAPVPESDPINAAGQVPNVEARPNYGGSAGQSRDEQSSATRLKAETPATAAPSTPQPEAPTPRFDRAEYLERMIERLEGLIERYSGFGHEGLRANLRDATRALAAYRSASAESTNWEEEARRYAQNADFWREKYESASSSTTESDQAERLKVALIDLLGFARRRLATGFLPPQGARAIHLLAELGVPEYVEVYEKHRGEVDTAAAQGAARSATGETK